MLRLEVRVVENIQPFLLSLFLSLHPVWQRRAAACRPRVYSEEEEEEEKEKKCVSFSLLLFLRVCPWAVKKGTNTHNRLG